nr:hypothetical protein [Actinomycetota bacterium]
MSSQLSLFAADAQPPGLDDVEGLLAGPGQLVTGVEGTHLVVPLDDLRRAAALQAALDALALDAQLGDPIATDHTGTSGDTDHPRGVTVRTTPTTLLTPLAERWGAGPHKVTPAAFVLDGARLRLWCVAAGRPVPNGYLLRVGADDEDVWAPVGSALSAAGLPA